jgi:hypothetical protein
MTVPGEWNGRGWVMVNSVEESWFGTTFLIPIPYQKGMHTFGRKKNLP